MNNLEKIEEEFLRLNNLKRDYLIEQDRFYIDLYKPLISYYRANNFEKFKEYFDKIYNILNNEKYFFRYSISNEYRVNINYIKVIKSELENYFINPPKKFQPNISSTLESLMGHVKSLEDRNKLYLQFQKKDNGSAIYKSLETVRENVQSKNLIDF